MEDRRHDPPHFIGGAMAAVAGIHERRGARAEADRLTALLIRTSDEQQGDRSPIQPWSAVIPLLVARGDLAAAQERLEARVYGWRTFPVEVFEGAAAWVSAAGAWDHVDGYLREMRAFVADTGCAPITWIADRLEGRWRAATGDPDAAVMALARAREGYADAGARHEAAVCDLDIAEARGPDALLQEERERLDEAVTLFERLRSVHDLDRVRAR